MVKKTIKESSKQVNAYLLKTSVQSFYRKQGCIVANEVTYGTGYIADVIIINKEKKVIEIETKVSKNDLVKLERKKESKHNSQLKEGITPVKYYYAFGKKTIDSEKSISDYVPDYFYFCVPSNLVVEAIKFCKEVNPKYGVMEFKENEKNIYKSLIIKRKAVNLLDSCNKEKQYIYFKERVLNRLSNEITSIYYNQFWKSYCKKT